VQEMPLENFQPFIDLILNHNVSNTTSSDGEVTAQVQVDQLFPRLLKLGSSQSTSSLEVFSKDVPKSG